MKFSLTPVELICQESKSTTNSPWGARDGLHFTTILEAGPNTSDAMVCANQFPGSDENYLDMTAGTNATLSNYPPQNRTSWKSSTFDFDETTLIKFGMIGINVGQAYIGGGGGGAAVKPFISLIKIFEKMAGLPPLMSEFMDFARTQLNKFSDCRGTVFIFEKQFSGADLLLALVNQNSRRLDLTFSPTDNKFIDTPASGCNAGAYSLSANLKLETPISFTTSVSEQFVNLSAPEPADIALNDCASIGIGSQVWAIQYDNQITIKPNFGFSSIPLVWEIMGTQINQSSGKIEMTINVIKEPKGRRFDEQVTLEYRVEPIDRSLIINIKGANGNFDLDVNAYFDHPILSGMKRVFTTSIEVEGQREEGNDAWKAYGKCVMTSLGRIRRLLAIKNIIRWPKEPDTRFAMDSLTQLIKITKSMEIEQKTPQK